MARLLLCGVLVLLLTDIAYGQIMRQRSIVCDLMVNGYRVSWPPGTLSERECEEMAEAISKKDKTKAKIVCKCQLGVKS